ncbi:hypothetical protein NPIL_362481 [Nephila pilipes]|uniref:Uncharacterized protein n=1 Tax=Nephila pilipes TaxID=299642 RepID=A0A8X6TTL9_NEPPI|nr:hypothetical protein NPIL_362481 [Nephila pilipes]
MPSIYFSNVVSGILAEQFIIDRIRCSNASRRLGLKQDSSIPECNKSPLYRPCSVDPVETGMGYLLPRCRHYRNRHVSFNFEGTLHRSQSTRNSC